MTNKEEALRMALDALDANRRTHYYCEDTWYSCPQHEDGCANDSVGDECNCGADKVNAEIDKAITAIRKVLAQPEQEPVAWRYNGKLHEFDPSDWATGPVTPLYTSPPAKPWVGLTDEEINEAERLAHIRHQKHRYSIRGQQITPADDPQWHYARAIEAKLKEKNK